jgi:hypothetical protein
MYNFSFINSRTIPYFIIAILVLIIWLQNSCEPNTETETVTVTVPAVTGSFKPEKPIHDTIKIPKEILKWKEVKVEIENPINMEIFNKYTKAKDSMERMAILLKAIEIKEFSKDFEDDDIKIIANGKVQGEVKDIGFDYTIKERKLETEVPSSKETVFRLLGAVEMGNTKEFDSFVMKANLEFENKKGNAFTTGFDTDQRIWLGYKFKIFQIKK